MSAPATIPRTVERRAFPEIRVIPDELQLVCLLCTRLIAAQETAVYWRLAPWSPFGVVAHVECATEAVPEAHT